MTNRIVRFKTIYYLAMCIIIIISSGCEPMSVVSKNSEQKQVEKKISFSISPLDIKYEQGNLTANKDETYSGTAIVSAVGDSELTQKPYLVLVKVKKISGGDKTAVDKTQNVIVTNGIGKITTNDWDYKGDLKMEKPVYELQVIGYMPYFTENAKDK